VLWRLRSQLPESRFGDILDRLVAAVVALGLPLERLENYELTDFAYHLIVRSVVCGDVTAEKQ
jgi:hypothetical protein